MPLAPRGVRTLPVLALVNPLYAWLGFAFFMTLAAGRALVVALADDGHPRAGFVLSIGGAALLVAGLLPVLPLTSSRIENVIDRKLAENRRNGVLTSPTAYYESRREEYRRLVRRTAIHRAAIPGAVILLAGIAWRKRKPGLVTVLALAEVFVFDLGYLPVVRARDPLVTSQLLDVVQELDPGHQWMIAAGPNVFPPNLSTLAGIRDVRSYDALESSRVITSLTAAGYDPRTLGIRDDLSEDDVGALKRLGARFLLMREQPVHSVWRAGGRPPAVGLYDLGQDAARSALPRNTIPEGFTAGSGVTVLGLGLTAVLMFSWRPSRQLATGHATRAGARRG